MPSQLQEHIARERLMKARWTLEELDLLLDVALPGDPKTDDEISKAVEVRSGLKFIVSEIRDKAKAIEHDRELSDEGKAKRLETLAKDMRGRVQKLQKIVAPKLEARLESLRGSLSAPLPGRAKDDAVGEIRAMEIRNRLTALNEAERLAAVWRAVEIGDDEVLRAVASAPKSFALVDDGTLAEALTAHWHKQRPELAEQVEQLETAAEMLDANFRSMTGALDHLAGIIPNDPAAGPDAQGGGDNE